MKKRVLSALLALCLTLSLAGAAFAENEPSGDSSSAVSQAVSSVESEPQTQDETVSSDSASGEDQTAAKTESTPAPTETPAASDVAEEELESTASEVEVEISTAETAQEPSYPAQDFEAAVDGADMTVNVSAPEGALPEDVILTASLVGSSEDNADDQAVADVAAELDDADVEYDGFVALDISFVDADGNKVEPLQPVSVNFTLPAELLPEDVDASTLEVQHLKENEAGEVEAVETVADTADATEGTVTVEGAAVQAADSQPLADDAAVNAEFAVSGFSTFTLTWTEKKLWPADDDTESISFNIVDTDGTPLDLSGSAYNLSYHMPDSSRVTFEDMVRANQIETIVVNGQEYVFRNATLVIKGTERHPVSSAERIASDLGAIGNDEIRFYDSVFPGATGYYTRDDGGDKGDVLELVYRRQDESSSTVYEPEPTYTKQAVTTDGGATYDLSLSVSGDVGESTEDVKLDVLFIVDQSGSMNEGVNYQKIVADCAGDLAAALAGNDNLDTRFAVVTFSSGLSGTDYYKDAIQRLSWTTNASSVSSAANPRSTGGTNYQAGLMTGRSAMIESRPDALKYVIFLSDGVPTYHYNSDGETKGGGNNTQEDDINNAVEEAANYSNVNGFFTIRVGSESNADEYLTKLYTAVREATGASDDSMNFANYAATNASELEDRFDKIQAQITRLAMHDVVISDTLSQWVEPVQDAQPYLVVKDQNGNIVTTENDKCTISGVNPGTDVVCFTADFDDSYELKQGYTYELHLKVQPTQTAYETFAANGSYPAGVTGDDNTGTYAGKPGFYSNVENAATLSYATDISDHDLVYPMPVVQVPSTSLTIHKTFVGLEDKSLAEAAGDLTFTVTAQGYTETKPLVYDAETKQYSVTFSNLVVTKTYTVTENSTANPAGFDLTGTQVAIGSETPQQGSSVSVTMALDAAQNTVTFTNSYTPQNKQLTVTKQVTGDMGSRDKAFTFTLSLTKTENGETTYYGSGNETIDVVSSTMDGYNADETLTPVKSDSGEVTYSFQLRHDKNIVLEVPYGYTATLHEEAEGYTASFTVDGKAVEGTQPAPVMDENHTVAYINRLDPVAPTGLEDNHTKPFGLMVGVAVMAGLALAGGAVVRRRRRWME